MPGRATVSDFSAALLARLRASVGEAVVRTGQFGAQFMREEMEAQKSGRDYGGHIASAPEEGPANWHDVLIETITTERTGPTRAEFSAGSEAAPYLAEELENGSPGGRIAPRPLVAPAAAAAQSVLVENVSEAIREALA